MIDLRVSLIQTSLFWEDPGANRAMLEEKVVPLQGQTDLILLPEMFPTGFTMNTRHAETMNLHTHKWMRQMSRATGAALAGSVIIREDKKCYNRLFWVEPSGREFQYDKHHLFRMAEEHEHYSAGKEKLIIDYMGWKIMPQICYDLRFPVWARNRVSENGQLEYDLLFYVANWPAARSAAWDHLLVARAVENHAYSIGLNRVGTDGNGIVYNGHSGVYKPTAETIFFMGEDEGLKTVTLSAQELADHRRKFPAWMDGE